MTQSPIDEKLMEIKAQRERARQQFRTHGIVFGVASFAMIVLWLAAGAGFPAVAAPAGAILIWGGLLAFHYNRVQNLTREDISDEDLRERIRREMERNREGIYADVRRETFGYEQEEVPKIRFNEEGEETDSFIRDVNEFRQEHEQRQNQKKK